MIIESLTNGADYNVKVSAVDTQGTVIGSAEATVAPRHAFDWIEQEIIAVHVDDYPWIREAWFEEPPTKVIIRQDVQTGYYLVGDRALLLGPSSYRAQNTVLHELGHHFTLNPAIYGDDTEGRLAVLSGWLYLQKIRTWRFTNILERVANAFQQLVSGRLSSGTEYEIFSSIAAGTIPRWFFDTYTADGTLATTDLDMLWAELRALRCGAWPEQGCFFLGNLVPLHVENLFGGLCSSAEGAGVLWHGSGADYLGPWVDGGCKNRRPQDVVAATGSSTGEIDVSWSAPLWSTTPTVNAYVVQWKTGAGTYNSTDSATVTELSDLSHTITGLTSGASYSVQVAAVNSTDTTDYTDDDGHDRTAETAAAAK